MAALSQRVVNEESDVDTEKVEGMATLWNCKVRPPPTHHPTDVHSVGQLLSSESRKQYGQEEEGRLSDFSFEEELRLPGLD